MLVVCTWWWEGRLHITLSWVKIQANVQALEKFHIIILLFMDAVWGSYGKGQVCSLLFNSFIVTNRFLFGIGIWAETPEKEELASCWLQPPVFKCWNTWPDVIQFHKICPELVKNNYFFSEKLTCKISFGRPDYSAVWIECATSLMTAFCLNWWMTLCLANLWHYFPLGIPFGLSITAKISELNHLVVLELHISPQ